MEQRVEIPSDGETLVGTLFRPDGAEGPLSTVVAAGGWCYTKEIVLPHIARIVNEGGVQFLGFDYAGFGESSGKRRQHLDPWQQISDYKNVISYVEGREDVDSDRIGAFGISYSGGHVLILAASDPRIKAITSVVPVVDGYSTMKRVHGETRFADFERAILDDRRARSVGEGGKIAFATLNPSEELSVWPFPRIHEVFHQVKESEAPLHEHWSTTESAELLLNYTVFPYLSRILDKKVLMVVAEGDNITAWDLEIDAFNKVASPHKRLEILPAVSHMSLYSERADTNVAGQLARDFFREHLIS
ncbi:alpha/beta hydrolase [Rhodococcus opacus]|uniref:Peptidase S15 n=1 Tax=Rhodococcus opacus TaxID=37919 RepID=A0A076F5U2_RHOOP|nr:alpha/beta fold hydrolase [Rhodococcus opacus]AII11034.1 peptidase S15 [Rhodococcus opacus]